jgi:flagellar basal-body rod protein FlgC
MIGAMNTLAAGMAAQRMRMDASASNMANAQTTKQDGKVNAFQRRVVTVSAQQAKDGSQRLDPLAKTEVAETGVRRVHDPFHPHAGADGYVEFPDINMMDEMVNATIANRAYEANVNAMQATRQMAEQALRLLQK